MADTKKVTEPNRMDQEHEELIVMIDGVRSWLAEVAELGIPHFGEMASRLERLSEKLGEHFAHEEDQGCLADAIAGRVRTPVTTELLAQHESLRTRLESLIRQLRESESPFSSWQQACEQFDAVCEDLADHEDLEMSLQKADADSSADAGR